MLLPVRGAVLLIVMLCLVPAMSGCIGQRIDRTQGALPPDGTYFLLEVRVDVLAEHASGQRPLSLGVHCAEAYQDDGRWRISRDALNGLQGNGPLVVVQSGYSYPEGKANDEAWAWLSQGEEPFLVRMPVELGPGERVDPDTGERTSMRPLIVQMELYRGSVFNLGEVIRMPALWTVEHPDGLWTASMTMTQGRGLYEGFTPGPCD